MAEEEIDYEAQYQARQEAFTRQRHADLLAAQRNAPAPANDAAPAPANDGQVNDDPEQYYRERTQARLAMQRSRLEGENMEGSATVSKWGVSATVEVRDMELLVRAISEFAAIVPPIALFVSYNCRFVGGNLNLLHDQLYLLNEISEQLVAPGKATVTGGGAGAASALSDSAGSVGKAAAKGSGGSPSSKPNPPFSKGGGSKSETLKPLVIWQMALLLLIWMLSAIGMISTLVVFLFVPIMLASAAGTAGSVLVDACRALPSICSTGLSALRALFNAAASVL